MQRASSFRGPRVFPSLRAATVIVTPGQPRRTQRPWRVRASGGGRLTGGRGLTQRLRGTLQPGNLLLRVPTTARR